MLRLSAELFRLMQRLHRYDLIGRIFCMSVKSLPCTDAVRVQLYRMASSPNVVHTVIDVSSLLCWNTSSFPSANMKQGKSMYFRVFWTQWKGGRRQTCCWLNRMIQLVITRVWLLIRFLWLFALFFCMILSACGYKVPTNKPVTEAQLLRLLWFYTVKRLCIINSEMTDT